MIMVMAIEMIIFMIIVVIFGGFELKFLLDPMISADMNVLNIKADIFAINKHMFLLILGEYGNNFRHSFQLLKLIQLMHNLR
jgi:hypothetical protein